MRGAAIKHYPDRSEGGGRRWGIPFQLHRGMYRGFSDCVAFSLIHILAVRHTRSCERPRYHRRRFTLDRHLTSLHRRIRRDIHATPFPNHA